MLPNPLAATQLRTSEVPEFRSDPMSSTTSSTEPTMSEHWHVTIDKRAPWAGTTAGLYCAGTFEAAAELLGLENGVYVTRVLLVPDPRPRPAEGCGGFEPIEESTVTTTSGSTP